MNPQNEFATIRFYSRCAVTSARKMANDNSFENFPSGGPKKAQ